MGYVPLRVEEQNESAKIFFRIPLLQDPQVTTLPIGFVQFETAKVQIHGLTTGEELEPGNQNPDMAFI